MKIKTRTKFSFISVVIVAVLLAEVFIVNNVSKTYAAAVPEAFDLRDKISIVVKNQGPNGICPYMSRSTVVETTVKLGQKNGKYEWFKETPVFSVITSKNVGNYVAVSTDRTEKAINEFYNGKYKTEQELINADGEYINAELQKKLAELEPSIDTEKNGKRDNSNVTKFTSIAAILKEYDSNGVLKYKSDKGVEYSQNELNDIRNDIKECIMNKGALVCSVQTAGMRAGLNGGQVCCSKVITTASGNHSVAIIGWNDNYSRDNFPEEIRPSSNGAYLIQNSWGEDWGDRGTFWVSYEDLYVEMSILCVDDIIEYKDVTAPIIHDELSEDNKKITINVEDKYSSGVDESSIKYKWTDHNILPDVNDSTWTSIKNGETINNEESKYIWIYAKDNVGNEHLSKPGSSSRGLIIENVPDGWSTKDVELSIKDIFTLLDKHSRFKIAALSSTISTEELRAMDKELENYDHKFTINKDGKHTIYFSKIDEDGRECLAEEVEVWIDKTPPTKPTITLTGLTVTVTPGEDITSGVKETTVNVTDTNGNPIEIEDKTKFDLDKVGIYLIEVTTTDNAGNKATSKKSIEVKDDNEEPTKPDDGDKKDEEPTKPNKDENSDKKNPAAENSNSGDNGETNSNNGGSQSDSLNSGNQNGTSSNGESSVNAKNPNQANSGLPQTGSDIEIKFIVLMAGTIFLIAAIHTYRKVKNS